MCCVCLCKEHNCNRYKVEEHYRDGQLHIHLFLTIRIVPLSSNNPTINSTTTFFLFSNILKVK